MRAHLPSIVSLPMAVLLLTPRLDLGIPRAVDLHISGRVVAEGTGTPLAGAQITVREIPRVGTLAGTDGRYALDLTGVGTPESDLHVTAVLIGYQRQEVVAHVRQGVTADSITVDFHLKAESIQLEGLVVTASGKGASGQPARILNYSVPNAKRPGTSPSPGLGVRAESRIGSYRYRQARGDREEYAHVTDNAFRSVEDHPLSTFSIDVDRASYSNVRRFLLREHRLPPTDAVQIEEMVNYFTYHYDRPKGDEPVAVTTEVGAAPWAASHRLLRIGVASRRIDTDDLPPANLVFLLDVSGSMAMPDKLPLVKASMRMLVNQLRPVDRVAIVVYAGAAGLVLEPTSGGNRERILDALDRLQAGGSTAGGAGLRLAYDVARRSFRRGGNNRVILATDGDFNVGESSDAAMVRLIEKKRAQGTFLTVLGFGTGNLQSEKMQELAQHGNGNYAYIDGLQEARKVLVREMGGTLVTVAKDVKVQVEFNPAHVRAYRLLGYENRLLAPEDFNDDAKDAGDLGAGHTVTALYEVIPVGVASDLALGQVDPLRYRTPERRAGRNRSGELAFVKVRYKRPHGTTSRLVEHAVRDRTGSLSDDFTFASAVAGFGMLLRHSKYRGSITSRQVMALAEDGLGDDPGGYRHGFLDLVRAYRKLAGRYGEDADRR